MLHLSSKEYDWLSEKVNMRIWTDGIWLVGNKFSKCWRFSGINYAIASKEDIEPPTLVELYQELKSKRSRRQNNLLSPLKWCRKVTIICLRIRTMWTYIHA